MPVQSIRDDQRYASTTRRRNKPILFFVLEDLPRVADQIYGVSI